MADPRNGRPRRPVRTTSRTPASRPRRIAGRDVAAPADPVLEPVLEPVSEPVPEPVSEPVSEPGTRQPATDQEPGTSEPGQQETSQAQPPEPPEQLEPEPEEPGTDERTPLLARRRLTTGLLVAVVLLTVTAVVLAVLSSRVGEDRPAAARPEEGAIAVPEGRPVVLAWSEAAEAADAAAEAAQTIVGTSWKDYDQQVDEATDLMTPAFAEEYRTTAGDIREEFVRARTTVDVRVVAQSVVRANTGEVQALLFLNQYVSKKGGETTYTPYRTLVTVVHTDGGWLVSDIETQ